jgi:hypothetical protein
MMKEWADLHRFSGLQPIGGALNILLPKWLTAGFRRHSALLFMLLGAYFVLSGPSNRRVRISGREQTYPGLASPGLFIMQRYGPENLMFWFNLYQRFR